MSGYDFIYKMSVGKPVEGDLNWYRLKWKPIKMGTYNFYITNSMGRLRSHLIGVRIYEVGAHNGWGRSWDGLNIIIGFFFFDINFWIRWNIEVHKDGPSDVSDRKPLNLGVRNEIHKPRRKAS